MGQDNNEANPFQEDVNLDKFRETRDRHGNIVLIDESPGKQGPIERQLRESRQTFLTPEEFSQLTKEQQAQIEANRKQAIRSAHLRAELKNIAIDVGLCAVAYIAWYGLYNSPIPAAAANAIQLGQVYIEAPAATAEAQRKATAEANRQSTLVAPTHIAETATAVHLQEELAIRIARESSTAINATAVGVAGEVSSSQMPAVHLDNPLKEPNFSRASFFLVPTQAFRVSEYADGIESLEIEGNQLRIGIDCYLRELDNGLTLVAVEQGPKFQSPRLPLVSAGSNSSREFTDVDKHGHPIDSALVSLDGKGKGIRYVGQNFPLSANDIANYPQEARQALANLRTTRDLINAGMFVTVNYTDASGSLAYQSSGIATRFVYPGKDAAMLITSDTLIPNQVPPGTTASSIEISRVNQDSPKITVNVGEGAFLQSNDQSAIIALDLSRPEIADVVPSTFVSLNTTGTPTQTGNAEIVGYIPFSDVNGVLHIIAVNSTVVIPSADKCTSIAYGHEGYHPPVGSPVSGAAGFLEGTQLDNLMIDVKTGLPFAGNFACLGPGFLHQTVDQAYLSAIRSFRSVQPATP